MSSQTTPKKKRVKRLHPSCFFFVSRPRLSTQANRCTAVTPLSNTSTPVQSHFGACAGGGSAGKRWHAWACIHMARTRLFLASAAFSVLHEASSRTHHLRNPSLRSTKLGQPVPPLSYGSGDTSSSFLLDSATTESQIPPTCR